MCLPWCRFFHIFLPVLHRWVCLLRSPSALIFWCCWLSVYITICDFFCALHACNKHRWAVRRGFYFSRSCRIFCLV
jgi:hypothetical protein